MTEQPVDPAVDTPEDEDPDAAFVEDPDPTDDQYLPAPTNPDVDEDIVQDDGTDD
jgi:hypothetical protein